MVSLDTIQPISDNTFSVAVGVDHHMNSCDDTVVITQCERALMVVTNRVYQGHVTTVVQR